VPYVVEEDVALSAAGAALPVKTRSADWSPGLGKAWRGSRFLSASCLTQE